MKDFFMTFGCLMLMYMILGFFAANQENMVMIATMLVA